ncbi:MAG: L,D-transpeptidase family protein [Phycisphaerales bacterium]|nr:L,D-transpeptidase family protein [Phycisphaerales bacterium]
MPASTSGAPTAPPAPTAVTPAAPVNPQPSSAGAPSDPVASALFRQGEQALAAKNPVEARDFFNRALFTTSASESDRAAIRARLGQLSDQFFFSPGPLPNDPLTFAYQLQSGDNPTRIVRSQDLAVDRRLIERMNAITDARRLRLGQTLKLARGPFHAVVTKSAYRLDLFADQKDTAGNRLFIKSFPVGLGEGDSTPTGRWIVRPKSKLENPAWVNPRTGEKFAADDPKNPIGEYWIAIQGTDPDNQSKNGYGLHGTIDPSSIGRQMSMGCVRLGAEDIKLLFEMLVDTKSTVEIRP